jgi:hypothetical protein
MCNADHRSARTKQPGSDNVDQHLNHDVASCSAISCHGCSALPGVHSRLPGSSCSTTGRAAGHCFAIASSGTSSTGGNALARTPPAFHSQQCGSHVHCLAALPCPRTSANVWRDGWYLLMVPLPWKATKTHRRHHWRLGSEMPLRNVLTSATACERGARWRRARTSTPSAGRW